MPLFCSPGDHLWYCKPLTECRILGPDRDLLRLFARAARLKAHINSRAEQPFDIGQNWAEIRRKMPRFPSNAGFFLSNAMPGRAWVLLCSGGTQPRFSCRPRAKGAVGVGTNPIGNPIRFQIGLP